MPNAILDFVATGYGEINVSQTNLSFLCGEGGGGCLFYRYWNLSVHLFLSLYIYASVTLKSSKTAEDKCSMNILFPCSCHIPPPKKSNEAFSTDVNLKNQWGHFKYPHALMWCVHDSFTISKSCYM